jgi:uncharacterized membrane protein (UPF0136 family)
MTGTTILWIYIALLVVGGLIGFLKARSKASIIASIAFAIPLALCAAGVIKVPWLPEILLAMLCVIFGIRFGKSKKFMPSGLMAILSVGTLIARFVMK